VIRRDSRHNEQSRGILTSPMDPDVLAKLCEALESALSLREACALVDCSYRATKALCDRAQRDPEAGAADALAAHAIEQARQRGRAKLTEAIRAHGAEDWKALAWLMRRESEEQNDILDRRLKRARIKAVSKIAELAQKGEDLDSVRNELLSLLPDGV